MAEIKSIADRDKARHNRSGKGGFKDNPQNINRKGRPKKGTGITDNLRRIADKQIGKLDLEKEVVKELRVLFPGEKPSYGLAAAWIIFKKAIIYGNDNSLKEIFNRMEGLPTQKIETDTPQSIQFYGWHDNNTKKKTS